MIAYDAIPQPVMELCRQLLDRGHGAWVVGGCVRDLLLGKEVNDWDIATTALPRQVKKCFKRVIPTGIDHGTVTVLFKGQAYEVTTLRGEGAYTDGRRPDSVHFVEDIEHDLARRDFTVNAIAFDPVDGHVADPFDGCADLESKIIRAVGDPVERFGEDGLRILRGARFVATLDFELEEATEAAFEGALGVYAKVSHERVRDEWMKAMKARAPSRAFEVMRRTGILGVTCPELTDQRGCTQNKWHAYDVWDHTMAVLDASGGGEVERIAALLHDVAKPRTREFSEKTNDYTFYHHETVGADMADRWLRDFRFSNSERERVVHLVRHHLICYSSEWSDAAVRRFIKRVGAEGIAPLLRLGRADALGKGRPVEAELATLDELSRRVEASLAEGSAFSVKDLAVSGKDVLDRLEGERGPVIGRVLRHLLERVLDEPALNDRERLLGMLDELVPAFASGEQGEG